MKQRLLTIAMAFFATFMIGCSEDDPILAPKISNLEQEYVILENEKIDFTPSVESEAEVAYSWALDGKQVATTLSYTFEPATAGEYKITFVAVNGGGATEYEFTVIVNPSSYELNVDVFEILTIDLPDYLGETEKVVLTILESPSELHRLTQNEEGAILFAAVDAGIYTFKLAAGDFEVLYVVNVNEREEEISAYTAQVFDFMQAPGQYVNKTPKYDEGNTHEDMVAKVAKVLVGERASFISLGGWGGFVEIGFDHTIVNVPGKRDFRIWGNSFAGSAEPGIIMVAYDKNKNGVPDEDEWYEIAGSGNFTAEHEAWYADAKDSGGDVTTYRDYEMTYYRPEVEDNNPASEYIRWTNNKGGEGYKVKNNFHRQPYFPQWIAEDQLTFKGIRLGDNGWDRSGAGTNFYLEYYGYGYADNYPNNDPRSAIDIDWAIDKEGNPANLPGIDFVKVINGIDKENGWLGEASTEVAKGQDLHALGLDINSDLDKE